MITTKLKNNFELTGNNPVNSGEKYCVKLTDSSVDYYTLKPRMAKTISTLAYNLDSECYLTDDEYDSVIFRDIKQGDYPIEPPFAFLPFTYTIGVTGKFRIPLPLSAVQSSHQVEFTMYSQNIQGSQKLVLCVNGRQYFTFDPVTAESKGIIQSYNLQEENIITITGYGQEGLTGEVIGFTVKFLNHDLSNPLMKEHDDSNDEAKTQVFTTEFIEEVKERDIDNTLPSSPTWQESIDFLQSTLSSGQKLYLL